MKISYKLTKMLKEPSFKDNRVCKELLKLKNKSKHYINDIGYLDIAISNGSKISYITRDRSRLFKRKYELTEHDIGSEMHLYNRCCIVDTVSIVIATLKCTMVDNPYMAVERVRSTNLFFIKTLREKYAFMAKPGRVVNKIFPNNDFTQQEIEEFSTILYSEGVEKDSEFKLVLKPKEMIMRYYHQDKYYEDNGTLGGSCMRYHNVNKFLQFYECFNTSILVLINEDDYIKGRAIIWHDIEIDGNKVDFMDRIYTCDDKDIRLFRKYAISKGMCFKLKQSYDHKRSFLTPFDNYDEAVYADVYVEVNEIPEYYPYVDTFTYMDGEKNFITNEEDHYYTLEDYSNGKLQYTNSDDDENGTYCELDDEYHDIDDVVYSDHHGCYIPCEQAAIIHTSNYDSDQDYAHVSYSDVVMDNEGLGRLSDDCYHSDYFDYFVYKGRYEIVMTPSTEEDFVSNEDAIYSEYYDKYIIANSSIEYKGYTIYPVDLDEFNEWYAENHESDVDTSSVEPISITAS